MSTESICHFIILLINFFYIIINFFYKINFFFLNCGKVLEILELEIPEFSYCAGFNFIGLERKKKKKK